MKKILLVSIVLNIVCFVVVIGANRVNADMAIEAVSSQSSEETLDKEGNKGCFSYCVTQEVVFCNQQTENGCELVSNLCN